MNYFSNINSKGQIPKGLGMIHRKDGIDQINLQGTNLGIRLEAFSLSLNKAKYVTKINLKDCGLTN